MKSKKLLAVLDTKMGQKNEVFGQFSFITGMAREYDVFAQDFCKVYFLNRQDFINFLKI
jgi:hypothetical protein